MNIYILVSELQSTEPLSRKAILTIAASCSSIVLHYANMILFALSIPIEHLEKDVDGIFEAVAEGPILQRLAPRSETRPVLLDRGSSCRLTHSVPVVRAACVRPQLGPGFSDTPERSPW